MKSFNRAIDEFCRKHKNFGIPKMMLGIVIISAAVSLLISPNVSYPAFTFDASLILRGQIWRLVTWVFLFGSSGSMGFIFTAIALYFYYFIGNTLANEWGNGRFTLYYLSGMAFHVIYGFFIYFMFGKAVFLDPMYLNLSMFLAFAVLFPDFSVRLFLIIPIKIKWLALINAAFFLFTLITALAMGQYVTAFLPVVALLNFILMCGEELSVYINKFVGNMKVRTSPQVINYKKEAKRFKREQDQKPYRHICAVCGKTDTEFPNEEFRYCSLCNGYHCFCKEHINNHIHFE